MKITEYIKDTKGELKHVNWPTRSQTVIFTVVVIILSLVLAYALGLFDFAFAQIWQKIIGY
ncbi:MAG: preprotein translocase subunit SecE [Candidatus Pacebacteria bacterium]|jgi:preprotein translocase subunit SecE|nr:preprotein translocase subunit SecE [Candidatus Paceibacterota bacterium]